MNIQIFGTKKSSDTRKAERFFKERGIKFQSIDLNQKGISKGEFTSVIQAGLYRHFKGNYYRVLFVARHSETMEPMVVYKALYGDGGVWVRPVNGGKIMRRMRPDCFR